MEEWVDEWTSSSTQGTHATYRHLGAVHLHGKTLVPPSKRHRYSGADLVCAYEGMPSWVDG